VVGVADAPAVDLAVGSHRHREREREALLFDREERPLRQGDARHDRLDLEHEGLVLQLAQGDDGVATGTLLGILMVPVFFVVIARKDPKSPVPKDIQADAAARRPR